MTMWTWPQGKWPEGDPSPPARVACQYDVCTGKKTNEPCYEMFGSVANPVGECQSRRAAGCMTDYCTRVLAQYEAEQTAKAKAASPSLPFQQMCMAGVCAPLWAYGAAAAGVLYLLLRKR